MQLAIQEPYMLTIQPDDFFISPRRLDENFGTMICFHRRYDLGDEHTGTNTKNSVHIWKGGTLTHENGNLSSHIQRGRGFENRRKG